MVLYFLSHLIVNTSYCFKMTFRLYFSIFVNFFFIVDIVQSQLKHVCTEVESEKHGELKITKDPIEPPPDTCLNEAVFVKEDPNTKELTYHCMSKKRGENVIKCIHEVDEEEQLRKKQLEDTLIGKNIFVAKS